MESNSKSQKYKIASRSSALALAQVHETINLLVNANSGISKEDFEIVEISTEAGDLNLKDPLYALGSTGLFTKSVEKAILEKKADFCVHSLKDLPTQIDKVFTLAAITPFAPRADVVILKDKNMKFENLPNGSILGTSSLRRISSFKQKHPNLKLQNIRGNLNTRLSKLFDGEEYAGIILAEAGIVRLGMENLISHRLEPKDYLYAPAQGTLGIECLSENHEVIDLLKSIDNYKARQTVNAERQFLNVLEGGCKLPIAVYSEINDNILTLKGQVWDYTGLKTVFKEKSSLLTDENLGRDLALEMLQDGGREILDLIKEKK